MAPSLPPTPPTGPSADPNAIVRLRECATTVRAVAGRIEQAMHDLQAFDRPDVWQGGRATEFRDGLAEQSRLLLAPDLGTVAQLRDAARRIEIRADAQQGDLDRAARDHLVLLPPP